MTLHVASLFSGIGLLDLGFHRAGIPTRLLCEADPAARSVLAQRFSDTPIHDDVRELTADDLRAAGCDPDTTVLAAGFPCQDLSVSGGRRGMGRGSGTRSALFWDVDRLLGEFAPRWVVLENVPGLLSSYRGRDMGAVLGALADRGYGYAYRVLDAQNFGVPQRRRRVVIVGHLGEPWAAPAQVLLEPESGGRDSAQGRPAGQGAAADDRGKPGFPRVAGTLTAHHGRNDPGSVEAGHLLIVNTLTASGGGVDDNDARAGRLVVCATGASTHALTSEGCDASEDGTGRGTPVVVAVAQNQRGEDVRRLTPLECERLQGAPDGWTAGQSNSARYRQLGNAVAVPVFEWVATRLARVDSAIRQGVAA